MVTIECEPSVFPPSANPPFGVATPWAHPQGLLHSHCSNTINTTVVMLGFWLCQFNTGSLACGLCSLSLTKFLLWFKFNIHSLR